MQSDADRGAARFIRARHAACSAVIFLPFNPWRRRPRSDSGERERDLRYANAGNKRCSTTV